MSEATSCTAEALTLPGSPRTDVDYPARLPGVVIYVHGVNSMGEWFDDSESGLCRGLNTRLQRCDEHVHRVEGSGQLRAASYLPELTDDGFIRRDLAATTFVSDAGYSPVIRFRWGYKASPDEVAQYGGSILLDESEAWGGGPFANGCSALPDMFDSGADTGLLLGLDVQSVNLSDRMVFSCPARHYQAFAAWRLAKLVARVRLMHRNRHGGKDCPVTVVCHSQGNMIGIGSAFFGANYSALNGLGVADTYVLANAPYSLQKNRTDNYAQYSIKTLRGRVTHEARVEALGKFFAIVGKGPAQHAADAEVDREVMNSAPRNGDTPCQAATDAKARQTRKRVFLYCNPHDRVISVSTVQGMGWLGLSDEEVAATKARGVLYQRVWAQAKDGKPFKVGAGPEYTYDYWDDTVGAVNGQGFWEPEADGLRVQVSEIWSDARRNVPGKVGVTLVGVVFQVFLTLAKQVTRDVAYVNAEPGAGWKVTVNAPEIPGGGIVPRALYLRHGSGTLKPGEEPGTPADRRLSGPFNRHKESTTDNLNAGRAQGSDDPYAAQRKQGHGDAASEAAMRYDQNAAIRQKTRRVIYDDDGHAVPNSPYGEDDLKRFDAARTGGASGAFGTFAQGVREELLKRGVNQQATNHSTILTNPEHSEKVLAHDVDVGVCYFDEAEMSQLRRMADWRWCEPMEKDWREPGQEEPDNEHEYYASAKFEKKNLADIGMLKASSGILGTLQINGERNVLPFQAQNDPGDNGTRVA